MVLNKLFTLFGLLLTIFANGQIMSPNSFKAGTNFLNDANGMPMYQRTEYRAEGSPYFYDEYWYADITAMNGNTYTDVKVKLNLVENRILYLNDNNAEMIATIPIKRISFRGYLQGETYHDNTRLEGIEGPINEQGAKVYQVLEDSTVKLYKLINVTFTDNKPYGEASITRVFTKKETYFALLPAKDSALHKVDKNKQAIVSLLNDPKASVEKYIESNKLNCKKEKDLVAIFRYYNSLE